jgi:hypothetical protein
MVWMPCICDDWRRVNLSLTAPSGIPENLRDVFSPTKYRGSAWWTVYFPWFRGINIDLVRKSESKERSVLGDSSKGSTEGSGLGELRCLEAPQGATTQDPCLQGVGEAPDSWEQHLSPYSLISENLEGLTEKVGSLGLRPTRKNRCGAAKKRARRAKMAEALVRDSAGGQSRPPQGGQEQAQQEPGISGTKGRGKEMVKSGPASSEAKGPSQGPSKRQRSSGGNPGGGQTKRPKIIGPPSHATAARRGGGVRGPPKEMCYKFLIKRPLILLGAFIICIYIYTYTYTQNGAKSLDTSCSMVSVERQVAFAQFCM